MFCSKMGPITHFFCEDVRRIDFARDMLNGQDVVLNSFPIIYFLKLNVMGSFRCHVVRPYHAIVVVIIKEGLVK